MKIYITLLATMISFGSFSCDVCGGITGPATQGLLPGNAYHYFGLTQSYYGFQSTHPLHTSTQDALTNEHFISSNLNVRWQFSNRFNTLIEVPFRLNIQTDENETRSEKGLGDIKLSVNHLVVKKSSEEKNSTLTFQYGLGVKLPTGAYSRDAWESSNLYPGTGAFDGTISTNLVYRKKKLGILQENAFSIRGTNNADYKFGNVLLSRVAGFGKISTKNATTLLPFLGASYMYTGTDEISGIDVAQLFNSGHLLNAEAGISLLTQNWMFQLRSSYPVFQYLGNGDVTSKGGIDLSIHYLIRKK